ncbi:MAG: indole-3-glycerol phosphate synthase TrpC [Saprospiraceae bacterium]|nr:indole-3-glycerol phosphate synthase TrpC [Saprospiraceae bacterium]
MLQDIIRHKREEVAHRKKRYPLELLQESPHYSAPCISLCRYLRREDRIGIIAEFKRKSPSNGSLGYRPSVESVSIGYMQAGASALSVLTDNHFFGGSHADLKTARSYNFCPILCKDFMIDPYQLHEARSYGADAVLLIAAVLQPAEISDMVAAAHELGMETIIEIHTAGEIAAIDPETEIIGVNNRDLTSMETSLATSINLAGDLPEGPLRISESGIRNARDILELKALDYQGFLIGTHFMRSGDPKQACQELIAAVRMASSEITAA